jgi:hypothetical protein
MAGDKTTASTMASSNGSVLSPKLNTEPEEDHSTVSSSEDDEPPPPPPKDPVDRTLMSPIDAESYFNSFKSKTPSRTNSVYSLSRVSFTNQLSQLTSLHLPKATSLSTSISAIPTAPTAARAFSSAAEQMRKWLQKASEVLKDLDAEDDVEWAAAGGREGLEEVDAAIGKFEGLIGIYVTAIEELQERPDIADIPPAELKSVVDQMEIILKEWDSVRKLLKGVKSQVELAMEWEELWNVVLGDIGLEMENLSRLVYEMEELRHKAMTADSLAGGVAGLDIQELETIVEETPMNKDNTSNHRFSLPSTFSSSSPVGSPIIPSHHDDSNLLALFARMQPLRASLDFLPMTLSSFYARAKPVLPTSCQELETRRQGLEESWMKLESEADGLRRELGEDRWVLVFRNAGRQAQKLCESVERSISNLQESIDIGAQHNNPPALAKKVENYEAKKLYYGPAIERVLAIIEKGVQERLTVNGEILRLRSDTRARWMNIKAEIKDMNLALDDLNMTKNQQLRDSISSIISIDRSIIGSAADTPGSSPASSVVNWLSNGHKNGSSTPGGASRRSSVISSTTSRPTTSRRYFSGPPGSVGVGSTQLPRKTSASSSLTSDIFTPKSASPSPYSKYNSSTPTPTPGSRAQRPTVFPINDKPRWNTSPKVEHIDFNSRRKPSPLNTHSPGRNSSLAFRSPGTNSNISFPSPLGRSDSFSPAPTLPSVARSRLSSVGIHDPRRISSSPIRPPTDSPRPKLKVQASASHLPTSTSSSRRQSIAPNDNEESPSVRPRPQRPSTVMATSRRISMLPIAKTTVTAVDREASVGACGRVTAIGVRANVRDSSVGVQKEGDGRESSMGGRRGRESVIGGRIGGWR